MQQSFWQNLYINFGVLVSLILIFSSIFLFDKTPELFIGGSLLFDNVIFNLSLSYLAGWIFWILTTVIPNSRDRVKLKRYEKFLLSNISRNGRYIFKGLTKYDQNATFDDIKTFCHQFQLYGELEGMQIYDNMGEIVIDYNNFDYLYDNIMRLRKNIKEFVLEYRYAPVDLVALLTNILEIQLLNNDVLLSFYKNKKVRNTSLEHHEKDFHKIYSAIRQLDNYINKDL